MDQPFPTFGATVGYVVEDENGILGAVDLGEAPSVILRSDISEERRDQAAGIIMALLLRRNMF
jgi:hypothetical protein